VGVGGSRRGLLSWDIVAMKYGKCSYIAAAVTVFAYLWKWGDAYRKYVLSYLHTMRRGERRRSLGSCRFCLALFSGPPKSLPHRLVFCEKSGRANTRDFHKERGINSIFFYMNFIKMEITKTYIQNKTNDNL